MNALVLDTNIVSYLMRGDTRAEAYSERLQRATLAVSFMTVAELYEGAFKASWGERKLGELEETLKTYLVVPFSDAMCRSDTRTQPRHTRAPVRCRRESTPWCRESEGRFPARRA